MFIIIHNYLIIRYISKTTGKIGSKNGATGVPKTKKLYFCTSKGKSHGLV